jgi:rod shape-determining protein MreD
MIQWRSEVFLKPALLFVVLFVLQITLLPYLAIEGIVPDLTLLVLVFFTLRIGRIWGLLAASVSGIIIDMVTGDLLGSSMFSLSIAIFAAGKFYSEKRKESFTQSFAYPLIAALSVLVNSLTRSLILNFDATANFFVILLRQGLFPGIYTGIIGLFVILFYPKQRVL